MEEMRSYEIHPRAVHALGKFKDKVLNDLKSAFKTDFKVTHEKAAEVAGELKVTIYFSALKGPKRAELTFTVPNGEWKRHESTPINLN